jgi:malate dehydrogenase
MSGQAPLRVLVTGAAGQIGYSLVYQVAHGEVFGDTQPIELVLLDIPMFLEVLESLVMELTDCSLPLLRKVIPSVNEQEAFKDIDAAFLVGAMPRKEGMERKDLLAANVKIFKSQGKSLANGAKKNCKVLVVGNPANTNAYICAKYAAPNIPARNISAMTRLDHNRACAQIAARSGVAVNNVKNVIIWGNHSSTQFPDAKHAKVFKDNQWQDAYSTVKDDVWLQSEFISIIQKRGAEIIKKRKLSSAMSAAKAACDHMRDWFQGTKNDAWVSMAVQSDGSYGIPQGIIYSFPVKIDAATKEWSIVQGLQIDDFAKSKMDTTLKELQEEVGEAMAACQD